MSKITVEEGNLHIVIEDFSKFPLGKYQLMIEKIENGVNTKFLIAGSDETRNSDFGRRLSDILKVMAISPNLEGYWYIRRFVEEYCKKPAKLKDIYPILQAEFDTSHSAIERAARLAIEVGFKRCNIKARQKMFGYTVNPETGKTNLANFISEISIFLLENRSIDQIV